uniref:Headcase N-terminal domain-containing protein n=1 Tax=Romanomermis culicivorax TaxID=13658 RepID=A0A915K503_ROMCU
MGKGKVNQSIKNPAVKLADKIGGCICPGGCLKKQPINPEDPTCVVMKCSSDEKKCTACKLLHSECYEDLELKMIRIIQSSSGRTRDWTYEQCRRFMWGRLYDLIFKFCKCVCGGSLVLDEDARHIKGGDHADEEKAKKKKAKVHKELPKLVVDTGTLVGTSTYSKVAPKVKQLAAPPTIENSQKINDRFFEKKAPNISVVDNYIPGLVVRDNTKDKNLVKNKTEISKQTTKSAMKASVVQKLCENAIPSLLDITFAPMPQLEQPIRKLEKKDFEPLHDHCYVNFDATCTEYADLEITLRKLLGSLE